MPSTTPKWPIGRLPDIGASALELANEFRTDLEPRLSPGVIDHLQVALVTLDGKRTAAANAPANLKAATRTQNAAAETGYRLVSGARRAIGRVGRKADAKAFGVGEKMRKESVPLVLAGIDKFLEGATTRPDVTRAAGILPSDLEAARAIRVQLSGADKAQGAIKQKKKASTSDRNAAAKAVADDVDAILAAAHMAFYSQPEVLARFEALVPGKKTTRRSAPERTPKS